MQTLAPQVSQGQAAPETKFGAGQLEHQDMRSKLLDIFSRYPQRLLSLLRWLMPVATFPGLTFVLRHDLVRQVLSDSERFPVPWGWKMELVTTDPDLSRRDAARGQGRNFVLGMKVSDATYRQDYALLAKAFPYEDTMKTVPAHAREATEAALKAADPNMQGGVFDLVEQLVLMVPARMCHSYYGIPIDDPVYVGKCALAVSSFLFGPDFDKPTGGPSARRMALALQAAAPLRRTIRSAMDSARSAAAGSDGGTPAGPYTPVQRLLRPDLVGTAFDDGRIHVQLFGMVMGFIPTNVLAAGNILDTLLSQPEQLAQAVAAADASDDERLWRCLRETLRFRNINLGPLRVCAQDLELVDASGRRKRIRAGTKVLACTQSAMFDPRSISDPHRYSIARADEDYLVFGVGQHWCIGAYIAIAQITQMFKLLLTRYRIARYRGAGGDMQRWQVFPLHMKVQLTPRSAP